MAESLGDLRSEEFIIGIRGQTGWGFPIVLYFFFLGTGAGLCLFSLIFRPLSGILLDLLFLGLGILILFFDLGSRWGFWKALAKLGTSWISRGIFLITILISFRSFLRGGGIFSPSLAGCPSLVCSLSDEARWRCWIPLRRSEGGHL